MRILVLLPFLLMSSCSSYNSNKKPEKNSNLFKHRITQYKLTENAGTFSVKRESGFKKKSNSFVVKKTIYSDLGGKIKTLERSITISTFGRLKNNVMILRPDSSQHEVWFGGKKYSNTIKFDTNKKVLRVRLTSPEEKWTGIKEYKIENTNSVYCFFDQVIECGQATNFFLKAREKGFGKMNFYLIWNGFPYFQEQYLNLSNKVISKASFELDQVSKNGELKISLQVDNQTIFFVLNKNGKMIKKFWIQQGLSMLEKVF